MSSEPECKCFYPASHEPGCAWKAWKDAGRPPLQGIFIDEVVPTASKSGLLNMNVIDPSLTLRLRAMDPVALATLCDDIRRKGLINPITVARVAGGRYQIIDGHRRYVAAKQLGFTTIRAYIVKVTP